jgi:hypothetical protein
MGFSLFGKTFYSFDGVWQMETYLHLFRSGPRALSRFSFMTVKNQKLRHHDLKDETLTRMQSLNPSQLAC